MENNNILNSALAQNTLDVIPTPDGNARTITGLVRKSGRIAGYRLSDNTILTKDECISLARQGGISGVGIAHRGETEYLKSIPDGSQNNNLSSLPTVSAPDGMTE